VEPDNHSRMAKKIFRLEIGKHLDAVRQVRNGSPRYEALRQRFQGVFAGRRCVIFGSARDCATPAIGPGDATICVNGSAHNAERFGVAAPNVTFLVSHIFNRSSKHSQATYDFLRGKRSGQVLFFTGTRNMADCLEGAAELGLGYDAADEISAYERAAIVGDVCGEELGFGRLNDRVSSGVTAVICALFGGAREVNLAGFSLHHGHSYTDYTSRRLHMDPDRRFFALCVERGLPVTTTSAEIAAQCGVTLA